MPTTESGISGVLGRPRKERPKELGQSLNSARANAPSGAPTHPIHGVLGRPNTPRDGKVRKFLGEKC